MKPGWGAVFILAMILGGKGLQAQTLTERLAAEDPGKLAQQARSDGNIVRGAILFHQGNINCAKCHRPASERDRFGPDLSRIDPETTDAYLIEAILQPSQSIKKGFETVNVLLLDGRLVSGIVVRETPEQLVLRDRENVDQLITMAREDIEAIRPGQVSSMPANLADELKDRQQFLDLLRYVMDIKERGPGSETAIVETSARRELSPELQGQVLMQERNCVACHRSDSVAAAFPPKTAPRLEWSAKRLNPQHLEQFIANPHVVKPGTTMPALLGQLDDAAREETARAITHFLASSAGNEFQFEPVDLAAIPRGHELFQSVGCVACHAPRDERGREQSLTDSAPLGDLTLKYNVSALVEFLKNPHVVRPAGQMPSMQLNHREATDIANFLLQTAESPSARWQLDSQLASQGEKYFSEFQCASCHTGVLKNDGPPVTALALDALHSDQGCLSGERGPWPEFQLDEFEKQFIRTALEQPVALDDERRIEASLQFFNCIACHERKQWGGVSPERNSYFQTTNLNLGDQGRIPPTLTGVGAKLKPDWMREVLVKGRSIRPYMQTRMPQFGEENVGHLVELFEATDRLSETTFATFTDQEAMRKWGLELAGNKGLNCVACHTYKYKLSDTMPAVDLTEMAERLHKDWFYQYMLAPQTFSPNTVMPSFWPGGVPIRKDLEGSPEDQIEALWQYLIDGRLAGTPSGVVREPLEIVVTGEAEMLRRSYPEIGKRGIGVGYPGDVNLAFDAEQMRLGSIWKGKFADPGGVWTGQGSGNVRPLGRPIHFAKGPDLDRRTDRWVVDEGRPPHHQFLGYSLDAARRPTFRYRADGVTVEDFFEEVIDESAGRTGLRRSVQVTSPIARDDLSLRVAEGQKVTKDGDGRFVVDDQLTIRLLSAQTLQIVAGENGNQRLEIPVELVPDQAQQMQIEYSWK